MLVDDDASVAGFQPGRFGQPDVGPHTGRGDDEVRLDHGAVVEDHAVLSDLGHAGLADETDAVAGEDLLHPFAGLDAETALQGNRFRGHQRSRHTAGREARGGLTTDQAPADHHRGVREVGCHLQRDRVGVRTQGERGGGAGDIQHDRRRARRDDEMPVRVALPACGDDFLAGDVDVVDGDAADEVDVVADEPARRCAGRASLRGRVETPYSAGAWHTAARGRR